MTKEPVRCKDCGWEGEECELDYHYGSPHLNNADWTSCPECGSEKIEEL